ncbi:MAG TPA: TetR/AcrR family transcriptional regulator [Terriglobales bacterium]
MSGKMEKVQQIAKVQKTGKKIRRPDARVVRTLDSLGNALVALMHEKPFDSITVQEVLDRAAIGRSTFYAHFRDKDDLFLNEIEQFFSLVSTMLSRRHDTSNRVAPVTELFSHIADVRQFYAALVASGKIHDVMELAQGCFARGIEQRLIELGRTRGLDASHRAALANSFAGALLSMLSWWINHHMQPSPAEMDKLYHQMVWAGVGA